MGMGKSTVRVTVHSRVNHYADWHGGCTFILNGISPIAKGDLKWRDALLVTGTVSSNQSGRMHKTGNPCDCQRIIENKKISD